MNAQHAIELSKHELAGKGFTPSHIQPTADLRFVFKEDRRVLQQRYEVCWNHDTERSQFTSQWLDVPSEG